MRKEPLKVAPLASSGGKLQGIVDAPPDKSITHRAIFFASLSPERSVIKNPLLSGDCRSTIRCFRALGVPIQVQKNKVIVERGEKSAGSSLRRLRKPSVDLDCGNSGTTMRLISGVLAAQDFESRLVGDASLSKRPMKRVMEPLSRMGANFKARDNNFAPITICGNPSLESISYKSPVASAQVKSSILLAGLFAKGKTKVTEPELSRDHTERMLAGMGVKVSSKKVRGGVEASVSAPESFSGIQMTVPGDFSSAAFFIAAGLLVPGSRVLIRNVNLNQTRTGLLNVLKRMDAKIQIFNFKNEGAEPSGDIQVFSSRLKGTTVSGDEVPSLVDEIPILAVLAASADGRTVISGAEELRVKESDRLQAIASELEKMGARIEEKKDGLVICGPSVLFGADVSSHDDHRIAMSLAVAALAAKGSTRIDDVSCVGISFPDFFKRLRSVVKPGSRAARKLPVIAIDGPAGAGKSTIAKMAARELGFLYIDTGAMYRSVTWKAMRMKADLDDPKALGRIASKIRIVLKQDPVKKSLKVFADGTDVTEAIRNEEVSRRTNAVSSAEPVRKVLRELQQMMGKNGGVVMEGRDIGTAVFPDAEVKVYLDASPMERAKRRFLELKAKGKRASLSGIARAIRERDYKDSHRKADPLRKAPDAFVIDSTGKSPDKICEEIVRIAKKYE